MNVSRPRIVENRILTFIGDDFEPELCTDQRSDNEETEAIAEPVEQPVEEKPAPRDRYCFVYLIFYLLGTSTLLPWYFFITCNDYWLYKFRNLSNDTKGFKLFFEDSDTASNRTSLQADFTSYVSIASTVPSTIFLFFNVFCFNRVSIHWRIIVSSIIILLLFIFTTVLVLYDTDKWQKWFLIITLTTVVILNMATALLQAALCGIFMKFPIMYISAFSSGQSLGGVFAAVALISTLFIEVTPKTSTFLYFTFADVTILISILGYLAARRTEFFKYHVNVVKYDNTGSIQYRRLGSDYSIASGPIKYGIIQKKIWISSIGLFMCFLVTTSVYPSIAVLVRSVYVGIESRWNTTFFVPVVTYLLYCVCEYLGRILAGIFQRPQGVSVVLFSILRIGFVPLLMLCNAVPRHHLPVLIDSDAIYTLLIVGLALSNGYLTNLSFILLRGSVLAHEQEVASTMLVTWLAAALSFGSLLSFPLVNLL